LERGWREVGVNGGRTVGGGRGRWELGEDRSMLVLVPMFMVIVVMLFVAITHSLMPNVSFINYVRMEWGVPLQLNPLNPIHPFHSISIPFHTSKFHTIHLIFVSISFPVSIPWGVLLKVPAYALSPPYSSSILCEIELDGGLTGPSAPPGPKSSKSLKKYWV
jgi:hypothetical protein